MMVRTQLSHLWAFCIAILVFNDPSAVLGLLRIPSISIRRSVDSYVKSQSTVFSLPDVTHSRSTPPSSSALSSSVSSINSLSSESSKENNETVGSLQAMRNKLDREFINVALPAFIGLAAEPIASLVDAIYVGRCGPVEQAGMGIAISAQYSVAKLYNDPLLKTSTSIVANKSGDDLSASVATAIVTAVIIGILQSLGFVFFGGQFLSLMGVAKSAEMRIPAMRYLVWRALGIPAATVLLVTNGIFRGRGDTKTPLYCTTFGHLINIALDPILIFGCKMGCAGAGAATAVSQWAAAIPLLYLLNRSIPFNLLKQKGFIQQALQSYAAAGSLIMLRTVAKISAYTVTSSAAARLGTIPMAAYSLTFNLGFATSQLCESISIAAQALIARDIPLDSPRKRAATAHVIMRGLQLGILVSAVLALTTIYNQKGVLLGMTASPEVRAAAAAVMPVVLATQVFKGLSYSTGGILLGGMDWFYSTMGMVAASVACIGLVLLLPLSLRNIWIGLAAFMGMQVLCAGWRLLSGEGPWKGLNLWSMDPNRFLHEKEEVTGSNANLPPAGSTSNSNSDTNSDSSSSTSSSSLRGSENPSSPQLA